MQTSFRVLFFDDNQGVRLMVHELLGRRGFEVHSYPDPAFHPLHRCSGGTCEGQEACADAIVTDLNMLVTNGLEFLFHLKERHCQVKHVALLTGTEDEDAVREGELLGARVFRKPEGLFLMLQWLVAVAAKTDLHRRLRELNGGAGILRTAPGNQRAEGGPDRTPRNVPLNAASLSLMPS
jgi:CheY-like chemotaxis protein